MSQWMQQIPFYIPGTVPRPDMTWWPLEREPWLANGRFDYAAYLYRPRQCLVAGVGGACCSSCAEGKGCEGEKSKVAAVGRSTPNSEINDFDASVQLLDADIAKHKPPQGDALGTSNWAALNHKMNGFLLRWGQWKTAQRDDWWWGDDDEASLAALKSEFNQILADFKGFVQGQTTVQPVDPSPPPLEEEEKEEAEKGSAGQQILDTVKTMWWVAFIGAGLYVLVPALAPRVARALAR